MGTVMSYAMALSGERPPVAGILAFSGFVPVVEGWRPQLEDRRDTRVFIAHGRADPIMGIDFARRARELLEGGGLEVDYRESDVAHQIDPGALPAAAQWLASATD
jgi:phospholipase/carboxylesterase